jgi:2-methylcitrate dehydratase PrpD
MSDTNNRTPAPPGLTAQLVAHCLRRAAEPLPGDVRAIATHSLLDWSGVLVAGWSDPSVRLLEAEVLDEGCPARATLLGSGAGTSVMSAALVNGMASHVLDFDDVHLRSRVHPSAPLWPAIIAVAERERLPGERALAAFVAGVEMQSRIAAVMGESHYRNGWHNTATLGMFGATMAVAVLNGLDANQASHALGICATQAGGLRAAFGTMCKPLQAGRAAAGGIFAANLARRGFTSQTDMLEREGGFIELYGEQHTRQALDAAMAEPEHFHARTIVFKYNASCYGTQAPIEACKLLQASLARRLDQVEEITVAAEAQYLSVCCIENPVSGLQTKFSIQQMVALVLAGWSTVDDVSYSAAALADPLVNRLRSRVRIVADQAMPRANAHVTIRLANGTQLLQHFDASVPEPDLARQAAQLAAKARILLGAAMSAGAAEGLVGDMLAFDREPDVAAFASRFGKAIAGSAFEGNSSVDNIDADNTTAGYPAAPTRRKNKTGARSTPITTERETS